MFDWFGLVGMFDGNGFDTVTSFHAGAHLHPATAYTCSNNSPNTHS